MEKLTFPQGFVWGTASASYQIEGAVNEDGRGESIWDRYCSIPGNIANGDTGEVAADHYHRYKEDVAIMKSLGMKAYRFSVAWPRIFPNGTGEVNKKGLEFYSNLIDELLANGIEPYLTMYHWDLPQAMQDIGGWLNPDMPKYFENYAKTLLDAFDGRVKHWMTLNEPYCATMLAYYEGRMAPGMHDFSAALRAAYYMYVAHGRTVKLFREGGYKGEIGIALNLMGRLPLTDSEADKAASRRADGYLNRWFLDPIVKGSYPQDMIALYKSKGVILPDFTPENLALIGQKLDFVGLNYYNDFHVTEDKGRWPVEFQIKNPPHVQTTDRDWPITEQGFTDMLMRMTNEYGIEKILITENGASFRDIIGMDGKVHDAARCDFMRRHVAAVHSAIEQGANISGMFWWSLTDNLEWACGYNSRFGIVYIDFATQKRIIKDSGYLFADIAAKNEL